MNAQFLLLFASCLVFFAINSHASTDLPARFVDDSGQVCIQKLADDGCNKCSLNIWPEGEWGWSCTELGCFNPEKASSNECLKSLPLTAFETPALNGVSLKGCSAVFLHDKICDLQFNQNGFSWECKYHAKPVLTPFEEPLCVKDTNRKDINQGKLQQILQAEKKHEKQTWQDNRDAEKICIRYEDACKRTTPMIFPSQTNQNLAYGAYSSPKFAKEKMRECRIENKNSKKKCVDEITRGELPDIRYDVDRHWLSRNAGIRLEDKCVRYENDCFVYYIGLAGGSDDLKWAWYPKQKNCSTEKFKKGGNDEPMSCTSFYRPD